MVAQLLHTNGSMPSREHDALIHITCIFFHLRALSLHLTEIPCDEYVGKARLHNIEEMCEFLWQLQCSMIESQPHSSGH